MMTSRHDQYKKAKESGQLNSFRKALSGFPAGAVIPSENPDFLINQGSHCLGIELTELHNIDDKPGVGTLRRQFARKDEVVLKAAHLCKEKGLANFFVTATFHPGLELLKERIDSLAQEVSSWAMDYFPKNDATVVVNHSPKTPLASEVTSITLRKYADGESQIVFNVMGSSDPYSSDEFQLVLGNKENRVEAYKQQCREVWLLIVGGLMSPSSWIEMSEEARHHIFSSSFDKVFYLHQYRGEVVELSVEKI